MSLQFEDKNDPPPSYTEEEHPLALFLSGDAETREDIILSHPDVIGFLFIHEGVVSKAFLPQKIINFKATLPENKKIIAAVTGDPEDYSSVSIPLTEMFND